MNQQRLFKNVKLEKILFGKLPKQFENIFRKKFDDNSDKSGYWQAISEARAVIVFCNIGIPVQEVDAKTVKDKNVDFLAIFNNEKIYTEVKGFMPEDYEIAKKGKSPLGDEKIDKALRRAQPKFLESSYNILVIADEDTVKPSLYNNELLKPEIYLNIEDYVKTSAIIILGALFKDQMFEFKIWYNANPKISLSQKVIDIFDQKKSNSNSFLYGETSFN